MLAGLLEVEGHIIKPSHAYTELFSLSVSGLVQLVSINPQETLDKKFQEYVKPLRQTPIQLSSSRSAAGRMGRVCVDLDGCDIEMVKSVINVKGWSHEIAVIALVEELKSNIVAAISNTTSQLPDVFPRVSERRKGGRE